MTEEEAREILLVGDGEEIIENDGSLYLLGWYLSWDAKDEYAKLDGNFNANELEAIAWWMRNKGKKEGE